MTVRSTLRVMLVVGTLMLTAACASLPETLTTTNPNVITDFSQWQAAPGQDQQVRLGGVIAKITNLSDKTRLEIVNLPINSAGKPDLNHEPEGRFVAYVKGFVDPVTFSEGRLVTVLGDSQGTEQGKVDQYQYQFPVMQATGYHLWRVEERVIINDIDPFYPCYGLNCRLWRHPMGNSSGQVIQEVK